MVIILLFYNDDKLDCVDSNFYNVTDLEYKRAGID